ncbi:TIGR01244 family sulfur transferase [Tsuneonella troitsensis]|uniref:TIGR01244 family sulfur transferase n=1 Tax=Tsuneonella troitsensis TaxID=292222 RepID=UPI000710BD2B|nr:TIGR01244 family sulfur transferase [Tsuneonella troitsensis]
MSDFRKLSDTMFASPQIGLDDVATARDLGIALIVNNRPEGESPDQVPGEEIEAAARDLGIAYLAIPITHAGFSHPQVSALVEAMQSADGPVLGYCRSGTRSTLLWALARASMGEDPAALADAAANAGYDVAAIRPAMDALAAQAGNGN